MPTTQRVIDTLIGFRASHNIPPIAALPNRRSSDNPISYMFKGIPQDRAVDATVEEAVDETVAKMDAHGIAVGLVSLTNDATQVALRRYPDRFAASLAVDGNDVMGAVRAIHHAVDEYGIRAVTTFPSGVSPQLPIDDRHWYPVYATCVDLGLPVFVSVGIPGPRVPMAPQKVELIDQVCYDFPELVFVMRHGAEPWVDLAIKLMLKWPNLYYSTTAFAPRHYPQAIIDYANSRGSDRILYGGYFPFGIELERTFTELPDVPFKDDVWPKFLHDNAARVLRYASTT
ncbi:amidohydrolase family protein [Frankia sp. EAN1pec]|uniref:amidohydrolase family protein n=1 Tax=Parafrankia sp. (strain EAN1pec) TaxID=298653 RepID=UPI00059E5DAC